MDKDGGIAEEKRSPARFLGDERVWFLVIDEGRTGMVIVIVGMQVDVWEEQHA
jgi:hypothetical protein